MWFWRFLGMGTILTVLVIAGIVFGSFYSSLFGGHLLGSTSFFFGTVIDIIAFGLVGALTGGLIVYKMNKEYEKQDEIDAKNVSELGI